MYKVFQIPQILFHRFRDETKPIAATSRIVAGEERGHYRVVAAKSKHLLTISHHESKDEESGRVIAFFTVYFGHQPTDIVNLIDNEETNLGAVRVLHIRCGPYIDPYAADKNCYDRVTIDFPNSIRVDQRGGWVDPQIFEMARNALELWDGPECIKETVRLATATA